MNVIRPKRRSGGASRRRDRHGTGERRRVRRSLRSFTITGDLRVVTGARIEASRAPAETSGRFHHVVEEFKRWLIESTLVLTGGNRTEAAKRLGMNRTYLMKLIRELGISVPLAQPRADPDMLGKKSECDPEPAATLSSEVRGQRSTPGPESHAPYRGSHI